MAKYPGAIPTLDEIFKAIDHKDWTNASEWDDLRAELRAALVELGTDPAGAFATVKARLDDLLPHFHDRGDPGAYDFLVGNLTTDGAWHDLDLSSIVPAGAKAVLLTVILVDDEVLSYIEFRKNGNINAINAGIMYTQVANISISKDVNVICDANRVIEYQVSNRVISEIYIVVRGWWK